MADSVPYLRLVPPAPVAEAMAYLEKLYGRMSAQFGYENKGVRSVGEMLTAARRKYSEERQAQWRAENNLPP